MSSDRGSRTRRARTPIDWVADVLVLVVVIGLAVRLALVADRALPLGPAVQVVVSVAAAMALLWRRSRPLAVAVVTLALSVIMPPLAAPIIAVFALGRYGAPRHALIGLGLAIAALAPRAMIVKGTDPAEWLPKASTGLFLTLISALAGLWVGERTQLVATLRSQLSQRQAEQRRKVREAQLAERGRIAREMHDVLAHRLAQLSIHAGALEYRADASAEEISRTAGAIRDTAHHALEELREVIGVLRADELTAMPGPSGHGAAPEPPHQSLQDLDELVADRRAAGARIDVEIAPRLDLAAVPPISSRGAYRVAEEALSNAAKHAAGARIRLHVDGSPGSGLSIAVRNPLPVGTAVERSERMHDVGLGLVGLHERVRLASGDFWSGTDDHGQFVVTARFPWERT